MLKLILHFYFPPLSQNNIERSTVGKGGKANIRYKTVEAKKYKAEILNIVSNHPDAKKFSESFDENVHALKIDFTWYIDPQKLLTKKEKRLSFRGGDWDNFIKYTQDCIMEGLEINDFYIYAGAAKKLPTKGAESFKAEVTRIPLSRINSFKQFL